MKIKNTIKYVLVYSILSLTLIIFGSSVYKIDIVSGFYGYGYAPTSFWAQLQGTAGLIIDTPQNNSWLITALQAQGGNVSAIQDLQCQFLSICSGFPTTTGYGNFGPGITTATKNFFIEQGVKKTFPVGWVLHVINTLKDDGTPYITTDNKGVNYRWYNVQDQDSADGVTGWTVAGKINTEGNFIEEYLPYDDGIQTENRALKTYDDKLKRADEIIRVLKNYYGNSNNEPSLYNSDSPGSDISYLNTNSFPLDLLLAIVAAESGGDFNNERVAYDYGHGIMQPTFQGYDNEPDNYLSNKWDNRGIVSGVTIPPCRNIEHNSLDRAKVIGSNKYYGCYKDAGKHLKVPKPYQNYADIPSNPTYKQYENSEQSIYANIKDGLSTLKNAFVSALLANKDSSRLVKFAAATWRYNHGSGIIKAVDGYLRIVAEVLSPIKKPPYSLTSYFPNFSTTETFIGLPQLTDSERKDLASLMRNYTEGQLHSPGELRVYDQYGNVTGQVNGENIAGIPNSDADSETFIVFSTSTPLTYKVIGTGTGTYGLTLSVVEDDAEVRFDATNISTSASTTHSYTIDWDALSRHEPGVTVKIDQNGDGIFERTVISDEELTQDEYRLQTETIADFRPDSLNINNVNGVSTVYIELPQGFDISAIDTATVMLNGVPALSQPMSIGDYNKDGILDLMVKFDRGLIIETLSPEGNTAKAAITGKVLHNGKYIFFKGEDVIQIVGDK